MISILRSQFPEVNILFTPEKIEILQADASNTVIVHVELFSNEFNKYIENNHEYVNIINKFNINVKHFKLLLEQYYIVKMGYTLLKEYIELDKLIKKPINTNNFDEVETMNKNRRKARELKEKIEDIGYNKSKIFNFNKVLEEAKQKGGSKNNNFIPIKIEKLK